MSEFLGEPQSFLPNPETGFGPISEPPMSDVEPVEGIGVFESYQLFWHDPDAEPDPFEAMLTPDVLEDEPFEPPTRILYDALLAPPADGGDLAFSLVAGSLYPFAEPEDLAGSAPIERSAPVKMGETGEIAEIIPLPTEAGIGSLAVAEVSPDAAIVAEMIQQQASLAA